MKTKHLASGIALAAIFTASAIGLSLKQASIQPLEAVAQAVSCDTRVRSESFSRRVGATAGINLRSDRRLSARTNQNLAYNQMVSFDAWGYGESVNDLWNGRPDALWLKLRGQDRWVPSAYMVGYPPSNPPIQPNCSGGQKLTMQEYYQRLYGHTRAASSRQWEAHKAIDSNVLPNATRQVRALVGGTVIAAKTGVQLTGVSANSNRGFHPTLRKNVRASDYNAVVTIWNSDLNRRFTYLHFSSVNVKQGNTINPGEIIGIEGNTGWSTGLHTHLAVFQNQSGSTVEDPLVTLGNARRTNILDKRYR